MYKNIIFLGIGVLVLSFGHVAICEEPQNWAVLVAGYNYYKYTYGFESGIYRVHKLLRDGGIPKSNIIVISPNTAAYDPRNPFGSFMFHAQEYTDKAINYYEDVEIDYYSADLSFPYFLEILSGNETAGREIGSGKVLKSGPKDNVLIYFISFGDFGTITLTNNWYLYAEKFIPMLENWKEQNGFGDMLLVVDAPASGSSFDNYVDDDKSIIVLTNGGKCDSLSLGSYSKAVSAYTSTFFTRFLLRYLDTVIEYGKYDDKSIFDLYSDMLYITAHYGIGNVPNLYGELNSGQFKLSKFFGIQKQHKTRNAENFKPDEQPQLQPSEKMDSNNEKQSLHTKLFYNNFRTDIDESIQGTQPCASFKRNAPVNQFEERKFGTFDKSDYHKHAMTSDSFCLQGQNGHMFIMRY